MAQVSWIKIDVNIFSNRKVQILLSEKDGDTYIRIWCQLLTLAGQCNCDGKLLIGEDNPMKAEDFAKIMCKTKPKIEKVMQKFIKLGMIIYENDTYSIKNWSKYQNGDGLEKIREQNRKRQSEYRKRKKQESDVTVTLSNGTDENRKETDEDKKMIEKDYIKEVGENGSGFNGYNF